MIPVASGFTEVGVGISVFTLLSVIVWVRVVLFRNFWKVSISTSNFILPLIVCLTLMIVTAMNSRLISLIYAFYWIFTACFVVSILDRNKGSVKFVVEAVIAVNFFGSVLVWITNRLNLSLFEDFIVHDGKGLLGYRLMGFTTEPSHAAFSSCLCFMLLAILRGKDKLLLRHYIYLFGGVFLFGSEFGFIFLILFARLFYHQLLRHAKFGFLLASVLLVLLSLSLGELLVRGSSLFLLQDNLANSAVDGSAMVRIMPLINYFSQVPDFSVFSILFGHGAGNAVFFVRGFFETTGAAQLGGTFYNYGLIGTFAFLIHLIYCIPNNYKLELIILSVALLFNMTVSTQMYWFLLTMMFITKSIYNERIY